MAETFDEKLARGRAEEIRVVPADPAWPRLFEEERERLLGLAPPGMLTRVEHYGSTSVPGLAAKPIVDLLVETPELGAVRRVLAPRLEAAGYDYFWRSTEGEDGPPWYAWCIRRDARGVRTHHIHIVEPDFERHWEGLLFRDYLRAHPEAARRYAALKRDLARRHRHDRVAYTEGKGAFIRETTEAARRWAG